MKKEGLDKSRNGSMICSIFKRRIWRVRPECTMGHKNVALEGVEAVLVDHIEERTGEGIMLTYYILCVISHPIFWRRILCQRDTSYQKEKS